MKTQYFAASTLDGFIAGPNDSLDWLFQFGAGPGKDYDDFIRDVGAICMGSRTYEWILRHLIDPSAKDPKPWPYPMPAWIFTSRTLPIPKDAEIQFVSGDIPGVHRQMSLAAGGKNVWVVGGGDLVGQFHDHGLLDELLIHVAPVILGGGAPLLPRCITAPPLRLVSATTNEAGFVKVHYEVRRS